MKSEFNSKFFRGNRECLRTLFSGTAPIVLTANGLLQRNGDNTFPFRQDSSFWYLTGINVAGAILVMDKGKEYVIVPDQQSYQTVFDGPILEEVLSTTSGIETILGEKEGWSRLSKRLKRTKHVATLSAPAAYLDFYSFYTNPARATLNEKMKIINPQIEVLDLRQHLTSMRMVKQPPELATMRKAIKITIDTLKDVGRQLGSYKFEYEIEADITQGFRKREASGHAFHPYIVLSVFRIP